MCNIKLCVSNVIAYLPVLHSYYTSSSQSFSMYSFVEKGHVMQYLMLTLNKEFLYSAIRKAVTISICSSGCYEQNKKLR